MDEENNHIHGSIEAVLAQLANEVREGRMSPEQMAEISVTIGKGPDEMHDVSIGFRVALIMQGFESIALKLRAVHMALTEAGAMFTYGVGEEDQEWLDALDAEKHRAFLIASVMVLRAGNLDASIAEDNLHVNIGGKIAGGPPDVDEIVKAFVSELDQIFPDIPPTKPRRATGGELIAGA